MKITLTMNEVVALVRNQYRFHDDDNIQVEIEGFGEVATTDNNADGWISVPYDWNKDYPTPEALKCFKIMAQLRNGEITKAAQPSAWSASWVQENNPYDIVKFRKAN